MKEYNFFENVFDVVRLIPQGRVATYGGIADYLGTKKSSRMVGWALNSTLGKDLNLPAHRVLNRRGGAYREKIFFITISDAAIAGERRCCCFK